MCISNSFYNINYKFYKYSVFFVAPSFCRFFFGRFDNKTTAEGVIRFFSLSLSTRLRPINPSILSDLSDYKCIFFVRGGSSIVGRFFPVFFPRFSFYDAAANGRKATEQSRNKKKTRRKTVAVSSSDPLESIKQWLIYTKTKTQEN